MIRTLRMAFGLLSLGERRQLGLLMLLIMVMALFEVAGVLSVAPFLAVLAKPELVETQPILAALYQRLGFASLDRFLMVLGIAAFLLLVSAAIVRMIGQYTLIRFAQMRRYSISARLLEGYLGRPYEFYLGRHSGGLSKAILSEVDQVILTVIQPGALMLGHGVTLIAIAAMLLVIDPWMALAAGALLGAAYAVVYGRVRGALLASGKRRTKANAERFEAASEALGGIKDIKLLGRERAYFERFSRAAESLAREQAKAASLSDIPRYAIEAVAFGGILLLCIVLMMRNGGASGGAIDEIVPLLGIFAFAGYRMMPAIQAVYRALTQISFGGSAVEALYPDLQENQRLSQPLATEAAAPLGLREALHLEGVTYQYPGEGTAGIEDVTLTLPALSSLGVVGGTGAGKTTLIDVILGLLEPSQGQIQVDGQDLGADDMAAWRAGIGYVPQEIFLLDASIASNIAMGLTGDEIEHDRVVEAARLARLDGFVGELPQRYETRVGERGVRLSGGQRQRIGIARALYHNPDIIVFDEATSALDNATEAEVMAAIEGLAGRKTVIMIAHRLSTVQRCDKILVLERGRLVGHGTYDDLAAENAAFQKIARNVERTPG